MSIIYFLVSKNTVFSCIIQTEKNFIIRELPISNIGLDTIINQLYTDFQVDLKNLKTYVIDVSTRYTLVPNAVFLPTLSHEIFINTIGKPLSSESIYFNIISPFNTTIIFGKSNITNKVKSFIGPESKVSHIITDLCYYIDKEKEKNSSLVFAFNNKVFLILKINSKLVSANCFEYDAIEDIVYFILATYKSHNIESTPILNLLSLDDAVKADKFLHFFERVEILSDVMINSINLNDLLK